MCDESLCVQIRALDTNGTVESKLLAGCVFVRGAPGTSYGREYAVQPYGAQHVVY